MPPAAPAIYGSRLAVGLALAALAGWGPVAAAGAQVAPPPPPAAVGELARRTLAAGQAMERSGLELSRQPGGLGRERACGVLYLAQVAYARAVELGLEQAEAEIDRLETVKQGLGCGPSGGAGP